METKTRKWVVLNCFVTQVLGRYNPEQAAADAAIECGRCGFRYRLSPDELARMNALT